MRRNIRQSFRLSSHFGHSQRITGKALDEEDQSVSQDRYIVSPKQTYCTRSSQSTTTCPHDEVYHFDKEGAPCMMFSSES